VLLLSGNSFTFNLPGLEEEKEVVEEEPPADMPSASPKRRKVGGDVADVLGASAEDGPEIYTPTLNDLAKRVLVELPKHTEVPPTSQVGIIFNKDEEAIPVSAWDSARPLTDFLSTPNERVAA